MNHQRKLLAAAVAAVVGTGCASAPTSHPALSRAQASFDKANTTEVQEQAPVRLREAGQALDETRQAVSDRESDNLIEHQAYLAERRAEIAVQIAARKAAEAEIKTARGERDEVLIAAREAEARAAKRDAVEARNQAERQAQAAELARQAALREAEQARAALAKAQALQQQVAELQARQTERGLVLTLGDVLFDVDRATLRTGSERTMNKLADFLREYPERSVMIEGFTDSTGPDAYNQRLSEQRANAVREALLQRGIDVHRVRTRGFGESYPVASNSTAAGRQQNRRVEMIISHDGQGIAPRS